MREIRLVILFGIVVAVVLFGLGMFQQDEMVPTPAEGTDDGNQTAQIREDIQAEYTIFAWLLVLGLIGLIAVLVFMRYRRMI